MCSRPVVFIMKSPTFETNLVLATLNPDSDTQTESTVSGRQSASEMKRSRAKRTSKPARNITKNTNKSVNQSLAAGTSKSKRQNIEAESARNTEALSEMSLPRDRRFGASTAKETETESFLKSPIKPSQSVGISSIFSSVMKRKSDDMRDQCDDNDVIPNSPQKQPSKKARTIFQRCFQTTFDPRDIPGYDDVEVEDSGDETP